MPDIFISYTRADRGRARLLADRFEAEGWSVWWDAELAPGDAWSEAIEAALAAARCVVVLWSQTSVAPERRWVRNEARDGLDRGILVPAMLDAVRLPVEFRGLQAADLVGFDGQTAHPGLQQLLTAVAVRLGQPLRRARPRVEALAPVRPGRAVSAAALRASVHALSWQGGPLGTGFALRGADLLVTDSNVHQGLLAQLRTDLAGTPPRLAAQPVGRGPRREAVPALPPERSQDVAVLGLVGGEPPASVIGLVDPTGDPDPPVAGEPVVAVVAVGASTGLVTGRLVSTDAAATIGGAATGDVRMDGLVACDLVLEPGSSGAPVLRPDGRLLGVVVASGPGGTLCVPASRLLQRLRTAGFVHEGD